MEKSVIILGAKGRFGRAATKAFVEAGWDVTAFARNIFPHELPAGVRLEQGDAFDVAQLSNACMGKAVIVNALNLPYEDWEKDLPRLTRNVIEAGIAAKACVMLPGNVYNYGNELPAVLTEDTPHVANTKKGKLRIDMEAAYRHAAGEGLQTIVLRAGDFFEGKETGNWFENYVINKINRGYITYPGPLDQVHAWGYLPDVARTMVNLAEIRKRLSGFEEFGFEGCSLTGRQLLKQLEAAHGSKLTSKPFPWTLVRIMALFSRRIREVFEMRYLWEKPHRIDDSKLRRTLNNISASPIRVALGEALAAKS